MKFKIGDYVTNNSSIWTSHFGRHFKSASEIGDTIGIIIKAELVKNFHSYAASSGPYPAYLVDFNGVLVGKPEDTLNLSPIMMRDTKINEIINEI